MWVFSLIAGDGGIVLDLGKKGGLVSVKIRSVVDESVSIEIVADRHVPIGRLEVLEAIRRAQEQL